MKFLLAILNSQCAKKWFYINGKIRGIGVDIGVGKLKQFPIPNISKERQKIFKILVDKIIAKKEAGEDTKSEEREIDLLVYKLYELTYDEVKIVDPEFGMSKEEYGKNKW